MILKFADNKRFILISLICSFIFVFSITPIGFITIGPLRATLVHIPVIIGSILLGPLAGAVLGFFFGVMSFFVNTFTPTVTSFIFSPFYSVGDISGNFYSLIVCFIPRIIFGFFSGWLYLKLSRFFKRKKVILSIVSAVGSLTNTFLVMLGIYLFFAEQYSNVNQIAIQDFFRIISYLIFTNGLFEAFIAAIVCSFVVNPFIKNNS